MEELLKNETVRMKIKSLSPPVKKAFIESLLDLYEQETEEMIDVIEESRMELMGHYSSFEDESKSLRAESRVLEDRRKNNDYDCVQKYVSSRKGMSSRNSDSRLSYVDEDTNSKSIKEYLARRGKKSAVSTGDMRSKSMDRPSNTRADSSLSTRSLPTPVTLRTVEEEKDAVMKNLSTANRQNEVERQRQAELIAKRREQRRAQKQTTEEKALELLEKALAMDKRLAERKQEQDQKIKDRLEDMKRKRAESRMDSRMGGIQENPAPVDQSEERQSKTNNPDKIKSSDKKERQSKPKSDSRGDINDKKQSDSRGDNNDKKRSDSRGDNNDKKRSDSRGDNNDKKQPDKKPEKKETVSDYDFTIY